MEFEVASNAIRSIKEYNEREFDGIKMSIAIISSCISGSKPRDISDRLGVKSGGNDNHRNHGSRRVLNFQKDDRKEYKPRVFLTL